MSNTHRAPRTLPVLGLLAVLGPGVCTLTCRAEQDYEYVKGLLGKSKESFGTEDLVERLIKRLEGHPGTKLDGVLAKASYMRWQALRATPEKRKNLLDEADKYYKEFLAGGAKHRLASLAEHEASTLITDMLKSQVRAAKDLKTTDPKKSREIYLEAAASMEKIASGFKTAADAAGPKFKEAYERLQKEEAKATDENWSPSRELILLLDKTFNEWIVPDKQYVKAKADQLECYDDADPEKKTKAGELAKYCEVRVAEPAIARFNIVAAWYAFMQGRACALVQNEEKAREAWENASNLAGGEGGNLSPIQMKQMLEINRLILHDLIKMNMKNKKYGKVVDSMENALSNTAFQPLFREDEGKYMMMDYARALSLIPEASAGDFERAVRVLKDMIDKESLPGGNQGWANQFALVMAEILRDAKAKNMMRYLRLSAKEWYDAARGYSISGQQEYRKFNELKKDNPEQARQHFEASLEPFQNAIDYYRLAASTARAERSSLQVRLEVEPKSWYEMSSVYFLTEHYLECVIACDALRQSFSAEARKKWMPSPEALEPGKKQYHKAIDLAIEELDKKKDGLMAKAYANLNRAFSKFAGPTGSPWARQKKVDMLPRWPSADQNLELEYLNAKNAMESAKSLSDVAKLEKDPKVSLESFQQSQAKYVEAAEKFLKVKTTSQNYESALYQAGTGYAMAQEILTMVKFPGTVEENQAKIKDLTLKCLDCFAKYEAVVAKNPNVPDEDKERRQKLAATILLARSKLNIGMREWDKAKKASDEYLDWLQNNGGAGGTQGSPDIAYLNKFRALLELAAVQPAPQNEPLLKEAEGIIELWHKLKKEDKNTFSFMLASLSQLYLKSADKAEKDKGDAAVIEKYENQFADLQTRRMELLEAGDSDLTLDDYTRVFYLLNKTKRDRQAADVAAKILKKFDPEDKNMRLPDDEKFWQAYLGRMLSMIRFDDVNKHDNCKNDHKVLVDFMYDTTEGLNKKDTPEKRPEFDKFNQDYAKGLDKIATIKKTYPTCKTLAPESGIDGKSYIGKLEEEINFRRKIEATRDLLTTLSLRVAAKLQKESGPDGDAQKYWEMANTQLNVLMKIRGETIPIQIQTVKINISIGKYDAALATIDKICTDPNVDRGSEVYFDAKCLASEIYRLQKKWDEAVDYPQFVAITYGLDNPIVKEHWPDIKSFLKECYDNKIPMPEKLKPIFANPDEGSKTQETPESKKSEVTSKTGETAKTEEEKAKTKDTAK